MELKCSKCKETKALDEFRRRPNRPVSGLRQGRCSHCRDCEKAWANSDHGRRLSRTRVKRSRDRLRETDLPRLRAKERASNLKRLYGITPGDYDALHERQHGLCAICGAAPGAGRSNDYFHIDHDHETGMIRGLLCHECNTGLGKFKDDPEILVRALSYLEPHKCLSA